jgi:hypothetical protein
MITDKEAGNMMNKICDVCIIVAAISLIIGIISRILLQPFPFGLEAQAYLSFSKAMLLFAIAIGVREFLRTKGK